MAQTAEQMREKRSHPPGGHEPHGDDEHPHEVHGHDHGDFPFLQHHFDTPQQQFDAGKLGIWLFLVTEVLFFAGLFCAYTIYRSQHPEMFNYAHYYLDTNMGALNTVVLLGSSLTAAWAVRNAQLGEKTKLIVNILLTIACACTFMTVKYFEYSHKAHDGLLWGKNFNPAHEAFELDVFKNKHPEATELARKLRAIEKGEAATLATPTAVPAPVIGDAPPAAADSPATAAPATTPPAPADVLSRADELLASASPAAIKPLVDAGIIGDPSRGVTSVGRPANTHIFFGIYFFMTGLHGFHVLAGIGIWIWMLARALKNHFSASYFGPIDYAALYWHLVDLIWIYLFPLLYLIH